MALGDKEENSTSESDWAFSTQPASSEITQESDSGVAPFSTDPAQNWGQRSLSNWGEEPRLDDPPPTRRTIWSFISRLFGGSRA